MSTHANEDNDVPPIVEEYPHIVKGKTMKRYHLPDEDDPKKPKCMMSDRSKKWKKRSIDHIKRHDLSQLCSYCQGEHHTPEKNECERTDYKAFAHSTPEDFGLGAWPDEDE